MSARKSMETKKCMLTTVKRNIFFSKRIIVESIKIRVVYDLIKNSFY